MALEIHGDPSQSVIAQLRAAIEAAVDCTELEVTSGSPGHFTLRVASADFDGLTRVKQQQLVYSAIADLMAGDGAPVHAIDRLECVKP